MKTTRRVILKGIGGAMLGMPVLESIGRAQCTPTTAPFAIFFRQANGVAQQVNTNEIGSEPERFFPTDLGPLTDATMNGRAVGELSAFRDRLLILRNVNGRNFDFGDGHANGVMQALTARGPDVPGAAGGSEAGGQSLDHRIGAELNGNGHDSLFLYAGQLNGWLGGPCMSHRGRAQRRTAIHNPWNAYQAIVGGETGLPPDVQMRLASRQKSVNDLVRGQLEYLRGRPRLSTSDKQRIELHLASVRDLEVALTCRLTQDRELEIQNQSAGYNSTDGDLVLNAAVLHFRVAALAVACGYTRSVALQIGSGNDGSTRYRNLDNGQLMENYHYISHRRQSHDGNGTVIAGSDNLHHMVDVQFARAFRELLVALDTYPAVEGGTILSRGLAIWFNDNANGPPHSVRNVPWVIAGSAGGVLRQGEYVQLANGMNTPTHNRVLNTIGAAVGVRNANGDPLDDFGDPSSTGGRLSEMLV